MANIKQEYATSQTPAITLASLGAAAGRGSTAIDNSTNKYLAADIRVKVKTTSVVANPKIIRVYLIRSEDGATFDDGFGGIDAVYTPKNAILLGAITADVDNTTFQKTFDTQELGITLPKKWAIGIYNDTGVALSATAGDHEVKVTEKYLTAV